MSRLDPVVSRYHLRRIIMRSIGTVCIVHANIRVGRATSPTVDGSTNGAINAIRLAGQAQARTQTTKKHR